MEDISKPNEIKINKIVNRYVRIRFKSNFRKFTRIKIK